MKAALLAIAPLAAQAVCDGLDKSTPAADFAVVPDVPTYDSALTKLDTHAVMADITKLLTDSKDCWPADYGNYGPLFVRLAWHCSGTYRESDRKGGCGGGRQRFEPERSWPDNTNLDKARSLLWPIKEKYGDGLSWGDLFTLAGTTAIQSMGGPVKDVCMGRVDSPDGTESLDLGPSPEQEKVAPCEVQGHCKKPLGSTTVGLIYLNPEGPVAKGPDGTWAPNPDPAESAKDVRDAFGRMGWNDEETVALIGGGHAFGKTHGACPKGPGPSPKENITNPWPGMCGTGVGKDAFTAGFEGPWTTTPTQWSNEYFRVLVKNTWEKHIGPGGHWQWRIKDASGPEAGLMRLTSDVALLYDPEYKNICEKFAKDQTALDDAFASAWLKLMTNGGVWSRKNFCLHGAPIETMLDDDVFTV
eukprot:TRINITY_DN4816_c0_g1_i1.p1 TRINITY_DN4816_c0_g1~~TRINITY_DN4816_c0_g1_i1.p1  ORF type:complete len:415 (-),score=86.19 TRINITY_DN4816_c0_g1_i1:286-1530(-)